MFDKVGVIGVGLIGGSIALAIKKRRLAREIIGLSRHKNSAFVARRLKIIDSIAKNLDDFSDCDLVILATPVDSIIDTSMLLSKKIKGDTIVIDVGSTKEKIVTRLSGLFANFVGCHPLAGSEARGAVNARPDIFSDSICILTPVKSTRPAVYNKIKKLWECVGARVIIMPPDKHDQILSFISHLPHVVAFSLIRCVPDDFLKFAPTSLKDVTRIAASDPKLWQEIFLSNKRNIRIAISGFKKAVLALESAITNSESKKIFDFLNKAKTKREKMK
jgi:prephenate dehydrogenase